jgi:NMT1-like family
VRKPFIPRFRISHVSWRDAALTYGLFLLLLIAVVWITLHFVQPAPPDTILMTSGADGSMFSRHAQRYAKILARQGVRLEILPSQGSLDNLKRLSDPQFKVDVGFVQGGIATLGDADELMSLGSVFYVPVLVFYRAPQPVKLLSELDGKRIAIGREGSGARALAETLLRANGIEAGGKSRLLSLEGKAAQDALVKGATDAAFVMGDSATTATIRELMRTRGVRLFDFVQADGYVGRFRYLTKLQLPPGSLDLGKNLPAQTLTLVAPTVELIARPGLHPALSDMLIQAAQEVHGRATLLQKAGEFPAPREHEYRLSDDAVRYYKSGKGFVYRHLPFWLASLVDRIVVLIVPLAVILIPGLKLVPWLYQWRINMRIYQRYGELMALERMAFSEITARERADLLKRLDEIEHRIITGKLPASAAGQLYVLRQHVHFVRNRIFQDAGTTSPPSEPARGDSARRPSR